MKRLLRASLVSPLVAPMLYYALTLGESLVDPARRAAAGQSFLSALTVVLVIGAPIAYAAAFGAALPLLWIVRRLAPLTPFRTILVGVLVGVGGAVLIAPSLRGELVSIPLPPWLGALLGGTSAAVWYFLALA